MTIKIMFHDFFTMYQLQLNSQFRVLAALPPAKEPGTHCTENWLSLITEPRALWRIITFLLVTRSDVRILLSLSRNIVTTDARVQQGATLVIWLVLDHVIV